MADLISREAVLDEAERDSNFRLVVPVETIEKVPSVNAIVLPCKVGDTVYFVDTCHTAEDFGKKFVNWGEVTRILVDAKYVCLKPIAGFPFATTRGRIFLTREEAEKALEGGEDNAND